ncbi:hypothetical protein GCM10010156_64350 [Planobispora rosea]|uniref:Uncharacterized protein n=1 Tax=Planobispora rosea TaxID=35762 RepID=A0A8J3WFQ8_PLARO|nr:hypothetical protein GCM10010156_64350 [Planobispora rosea]GIH87695.1 hypothetical protein Pro02_61030 [Planobispora rosea]
MMDEESVQVSRGGDVAEAGGRARGPVEVDAAGTLYPAQTGLTAPYDPTSARVKA